MKPIILFLAATVFLASCASTTMIQSNPAGADIYINHQKKGVTPYRLRDTKIVGTRTDITLKKEGYQDFNVVIRRNERLDVGALISGILVYVPFLWIMKYDRIHSYELTPSPEK